jgi:hypothetical protein
MTTVTGVSCDDFPMTEGALVPHPPAGWGATLATHPEWGQATRLGGALPET